MSENSPKSFTIDQIAEPDDLQSVIYSMLAIPHLSPVNIFNEFAAPDLDPSQLGSDSTRMIQASFSWMKTAQFYSLTIYADHRRLAIDPYTWLPRSSWPKRSGDWFATGPSRFQSAVSSTMSSLPIRLPRRWSWRPGLVSTRQQKVIT